MSIADEWTVKRERSLSGRIAALKEKNLAAGRLLAQEKFFEDAGHPFFSQTPGWKARARMLGIPVSGHRYCVAALELDERQDGSPEQNARLLAAGDIAEEYMSALAFRLVTVRAPRLVMILCAPAEPAGGNVFGAVLDKVRKAVKSLLSTTCTIGVSRTTASVHGVHECRTEVVKALQDTVPAGKDRIVAAADISGNNGKPAFCPDTVQGIVAQVQRMIRENYAGVDLSLSIIAGKVYLSSAYLSKLYKKETGETYVEYLTRVRVDEAKKLLKNSSMKSSEIGMLVGYPNAQYFCFLFRKYTGMSPIEFRESEALV